MKIFFSTLILSLIVLNQFSLAQEITEAPKQYVVVGTAYSPNSMIFLGKTPGTNTFVTTIEYGKKINSLDNGTELYVTRTVIPFTEYVYPKRDNGNVTDVVYGYGISPLGYQLNYPGKWASLIGGVSGGFMLMNRTFPTDKGRRFNYTFDIKLGIEKSIFTNTFLSLGYRFHHISNAQTGSQNPGIDSNFLFLSIKYFTNAN